MLTSCLESIIMYQDMIKMKNQYDEKNYVSASEHESKKIEDNCKLSFTNIGYEYDYFVLFGEWRMKIECPLI